MRQPPTDLTRSLILPAIAVMACFASLLPPAGARGDVIYRCVRKDGETIISFNRKLDGMKCSVHENLDREPSKPKGAKCHTQRYRDTIFYKCEKNGVWYIFNKASKSGGDAAASGDSGSSGARNDGTWLITSANPPRTAERSLIFPESWLRPPRSSGSRPVF